MSYWLLATATAGSPYELRMLHKQQLSKNIKLEFIIIGVVMGILVFAAAFFFLKRDRAVAGKMNMYSSKPSDIKIPIDISNVRRMIENNQKINAIKYVRDAENLSLLDAKELVERIEKGDADEKLRSAFADAKSTDDVLDIVVKELLRKENKIAAIKYVVEKKKLRLIEAKAYVERIEEGLK